MPLFFPLSLHACVINHFYHFPLKWPWQLTVHSVSSNKLFSFSRALSLERGPQCINSRVWMTGAIPLVGWSLFTLLVSCELTVRVALNGILSLPPPSPYPCYFYFCRLLLLFFCCDSLLLLLNIWNSWNRIIKVALGLQLLYVLQFFKDIKKINLRRCSCFFVFSPQFWNFKISCIIIYIYIYLYLHVHDL